MRSMWYWEITWKYIDTGASEEFSFIGDIEYIMALLKTLVFVSARSLEQVSKGMQ